MVIFSHVLSSSSFYLSFLFIKRSKGVMIAQQSFGGNCQPVQNWLQGQMKQNRANRWHSLENLSKFYIFSYFFTIEKSLHRKNLLGTFVFCLFCFIFFPVVFYWACALSFEGYPVLHISFKMRGRKDLTVLRSLIFSNSGVRSFKSHKNQISDSAVRRDLRFFLLIRED